MCLFFFSFFLNSLSKQCWSPGRGRHVIHEAVHLYGRALYFFSFFVKAALLLYAGLPKKCYIGFPIKHKNRDASYSTHTQRLPEKCFNTFGSEGKQKCNREQRMMTDRKTGGLEFVVLYLPRKNLLYVRYYHVNSSLTKRSSSSSIHVLTANSIMRQNYFWEYVSQYASDTQTDVMHEQIKQTNKKKAYSLIFNKWIQRNCLLAVL